jgi:hypothetical protein
MLDELTKTSERQVTLAALEPNAPLYQLEEVVTLLGNLAQRAYSGDREAYQSYQAIMYLDIHRRGRSVRDPKRLWLAQELYRIEERSIPDVQDPGTSSPEAFKTLIEEERSRRARLTHPMSVYLYQESPGPQQIDLFLRHHWLRSSLFYRLIGECALRFESFEDSTPLYENMFDETGNGDPNKAHPILLRNLLRYRGLAADDDAASTMPEEQAYLNNRIRCLRHPDEAWGLALVYLLESVTAANHKKIYRMLEQAGIPADYREFHYLHGFVDEVHSAELWELVARRSHEGAFRRTFLRSVQHHFDVTRQYYDALWAEMQALSV